MFFCLLEVELMDPGEPGELMGRSHKLLGKRRLPQYGFEKENH
jgi:hypothetical protein